MKFLALLGALSVPLCCATGPQLLAVKSVYVLPMRLGMDQYLASQLTRKGNMEVVADPQKADAVLTDRIGENFETKLDTLYPKPSSGDDSSDDDSGAVASSSIPQSSFSSTRGTFFLVDRRTRAVLWSAYVPPHTTRPNDLHKTADHVVHKLAADIHELQTKK